MKNVNNVIFHDNMDRSCLGGNGLHLSPRGSGRLALNYLRSQISDLRFGVFSNTSAARQGILSKKTCHMSKLSPFVSIFNPLPKHKGIPSSE